MFVDCCRRDGSYGDGSIVMLLMFMVMFKGSRRK